MAKLALAFEHIRYSSVPLIPVLKRNYVQRIAMNTHPLKQPSEKQCSKDEYIQQFCKGGSVAEWLGRRT